VYRNCRPCPYRGNDTALMNEIFVWTAPTSDDFRRDAHDLVRTEVAALLGRPVAEIRVTHDASGRPCLEAPAEDLFVSISHSGGFAAVAATPLGPVGVDIERVRPLDACALAERWMSAADAGWVRDRPAEARDAAALWLWTQKEAIGKARGRGLRGGGTRQAVSFEEPFSPAPRLRPVPGDPGLLAGASTALPGFVLAVACRPGTDHVELVTHHRH
jgi:4'-phosphopantetheinyl transferase